MRLEQNEGKTIMETFIKFNPEQLTADGRRLLAAVTAQNRHLATILQPRDGVVWAEIAGHTDSDDVVRVRVQDKLTFAERARQYGIEALDPAYVSRDEVGHPIAASDGWLPTEEYIREKQEFFGDAIERRSREWSVPREIVGRVRHGELAGADAWNEIAAEFASWCEAGQFEVVIDPDWVTMTAAAKEFGVTQPQVTQAALRGQLATWEDWREPNPQKRRRVSRQDAARLWGKG